MNKFTWKTLINGFADKIFNLSGIFKAKPTESINEVLFYGGDDEEKRKQVGLNNLFCIYYIIAHAGRSIDICIPCLDSDTITKCLIDVKQKNNVVIRILVQEDKDFYNLQSLVSNAIDVRVVRSGVKLEHEFIIIDAEENSTDAIAMLGSIDYEIDRVNCCRDATILTSETTLISALMREFERVWNSMGDIEIFNQIDDIVEIK